MKQTIHCNKNVFIRHLWLVLFLATSLYSNLSFAQCPLGGNITFTSQAEIDNFATNYPLCTILTGDVMIAENSSGPITDLNGLSQLASIGGDLIIFGNRSLTSLKGLDNITSIGGDLKISANYKLISLNGLSKLTSIGGDLEIASSSSLSNLSGLDKVTFIGGDLTIRLNAALSSLSGLDNVTTIGGGIVIDANYTLGSLSGLDNVTTIGGGIAITSNYALSSLSGLNNIDPTTITDLQIFVNPSLPICHVQSICDYLDIPENPATIFANQTGCHSRMEVEEACLGALPVELITFTGKEDRGNILLEWQTATELNNLGFDIEHSHDGRNWNILDFVYGNGTTTTQQTYTYLDKNPLASVNYYRLKQIDFDGAFKYSRIVSVTIERGVSGMLCYPNPTIKTINLLFNAGNESKVVIHVSDAFGNTRLYEKHRATIGQNHILLDVDALKNGIYLILVEVGKDKHSLRFVKTDTY